MSNAELPEIEFTGPMGTNREGYTKEEEQDWAWFVAEHDRTFDQGLYSTNDAKYYVKRAVIRALKLKGHADLVSSAAAPKIYADGFCAHCSELAYPLTRALEATGVPTGETNWQRSYGPNKIRALSDHESSLRRLLRVLKEGKPEDLKDAIQNAEFYIEFHAAIRRRLTAVNMEKLR